MINENRGWFFVVDGGCGRLMQSIVVPPGRLRVEQHGTLSNRSLGLEHVRPSSLKGKSGNSYASGGHEAEEEIHRFAKEVAAWLEREIDRHDIEDLTVFFSPRLLGELRKVFNPNLEHRVRTQQADLTSLTPSGLARHPAIQALPPGQHEELPGS